ncbi:MAG: hypothetical protein NT027_01820 [Proteobacteria bacterium]|nr:hypothetical protein [Pseudomonadota bacterium]
MITLNRILCLLSLSVSTFSFAAQNIVIQPGSSISIFPGMETNVTCSGSSAGGPIILDKFCVCAFGGYSSRYSWKINRKLFLSDGTEKIQEVASSPGEFYNQTDAANECEAKMMLNPACRPSY